MTTNAPSAREEQTEALATCRTSHGVEIRSPLRRLNHHAAIFEIYTGDIVLRVSEVLTEFKISLREQVIYSGRAVVSNLLQDGNALVCEVALDESWCPTELAAALPALDAVETEFANFLRQYRGAFKVRPAFKLMVADLQMLLMDLKSWLDQLELALRGNPSGDRDAAEIQVLSQLQGRVVPWLAGAFERFEEAAEEIEPDERPLHASYAKRQLHRLVLSAPFMYRTFQKPLGYAGDYEMVNMMTRDPFEGSSLFAKMLNTYFLSTAPVVAHRNRIEYLEQHLLHEAARVAAQGRPMTIFNLGCGPAKEIQQFLQKHNVSNNVNFTLLDFNDETLMHVRMVLEEVKRQSGRRSDLQLIRKSVAQFIKGGAKASAGAKAYDMVYCAGLFDYLPDHVCATLLEILYDSLRPSGLLLATNVAPSNPCQAWMEYAVDWQLIYRDHAQLLALRPSKASPDYCQIRSEDTGVNISLEVRKPAHGSG
ncbi:MAG: class I SAM-dependent methyltransferase [Verrucomicrobiota bacterium]